jgi:hypothetical protein
MTRALEALACASKTSNCSGVSTVMTPGACAGEVDLGCGVEVDVGCGVEVDVGCGVDVDMGCGVEVETGLGGAATDIRTADRRRDVLALFGIATGGVGGLRVPVKLIGVAATNAILNWRFQLT